MKTIFIMLLVGIEIIIAQNPTENIKKYWFYRYRMQNNFMVRSEANEFGTNMVANERGFAAGGNIIQWGDGGLTHGWYISLLASEYYLLSINGLNTDSIKRELYLALEAFNRLDYYAETYFSHPLSGSGTPVLNGFFVREDQIGSFDFNLNGDSALPMMSQDYINKLNSNKVISFSDSIFFSRSTVDTLGKYTEPTHDQYWQMYMGLALVTKLVDIGAHYGTHQFMDGQTSIKLEAQAINERLINYMKGLAGEWEILNPVTLTCVRATTGTTGQGSCATVQFPPCTNFCGANLFSLTYAAAEAACAIKNEFDAVDILNSVPVGCTEYHNGVSLAEYLTWNIAFQQPFYGNESLKFLTLAALGNSWYGSTLVNITMPLLSNHAQMHDHEHLPLVRQILFGGGNLINSSFYDSLLNAAPCQGPWNFGLSDQSPSWEWTSTNRFTHPQRRGGASENSFLAEYPGLDYMLLHNLYSIVEASNLPHFENYMDYKIPYGFPYTISGQGTFGDANNPLNVKAFRSIHVAGDVLSNGAGTFLAGEEVIFDDEQELQINAEIDFSLKQDPWECVSGDYQKLADGGNPGLYGMPALPFHGYGNGLRYNTETPSPVQSTSNSSSGPITTAICYPNPATDQITVSVVPGSPENLEYNLFDFSGRLLRSGVTGNNGKIILSDLEPGAYVIRVTINGTYRSFKVNKI